MDLDSFLVSLNVYIDEWWKTFHRPNASRKPGRPALLSESEVLTLAILAQWPRFRSEPDFWRFASSHLRSYFPTLCSQTLRLNTRPCKVLEYSTPADTMARTVALTG